MTSRTLIRRRRLSALLLLLGVAFLMTASTLPASAADKYRVYVGTYTDKASKGIYVFDLDGKTGATSNLRLAAEAKSPSFLAIHPGKKYLYAVNEIGEGGKSVGAVSAFAIDEATGALSFLSAESTGGAGPCHLSVDPSGKHVLAANYGGGSVCSIPIGEGGKVGKTTTFIQHEGSSVNPQRQQGPHAHSINLDPGGRFAFAADLGLDKVLVYKFDADSGKIAANEPPAASVAPGAGPRHFAFHPSGKFAYVINEIGNTVTAFSYDAEKGVLHPIQNISTLPDGFKGTSYTAEVVVHPSGRFLYGSNRGHDSIAVFSIDAESGKLTAAGHQGQGIKTPRNFAVEPGGKFVLVCNQSGGDILVFAVDPQTGALTPTGSRVEVPNAVCARFLAIP